MFLGVRDGLISRTPNAGGTMGKVIAAITTSVDGYIVGPQDGPEYGLGIGGERLHYWAMGGPWTYADDGRDTDGMRGADREYYESLTEGLGCGIVGRNMYDAADAWGGTKPFPLDDCAVRQRSERGDVHDDAFWLVLDDCLRRWSFSGYAGSAGRTDRGGRRAAGGRSPRPRIPRKDQPGPRPP
jgi:dihydrofolate reductase